MLYTALMLALLKANCKQAKELSGLTVVHFRSKLQKRGPFACYKHWDGPVSWLTKIHTTVEILKFSAI